MGGDWIDAGNGGERGVIDGGDVTKGGMGGDWIDAGNGGERGVIGGGDVAKGGIGGNCLGAGKGDCGAGGGVKGGGIVLYPKTVKDETVQDGEPDMVHTSLKALNPIADAAECTPPTAPLPIDLHVAPASEDPNTEPPPLPKNRNVCGERYDGLAETWIHSPAV
jgi:hypothetical protein